jgi:hypothetical protein
MSTAESQLMALGWLAGTWRNDACEAHYSSPDGGLILSHTKFFQDGKLASFELERFEVRGNQVVEVPAPNGVPSPVVFTLTALVGQRAVFENPGHDFPCWICYARTGDRLVIEAKGQDGRGFRLDLAR